MFDVEEWLPFLVAKAHQAINARIRESLTQFKLTPPQFFTLAFLWKKDGLNQQELGKLINVDRTTIGGIIERLERLELIQKGQDPRDRRSCVIFVTKKGFAIREDILQKVGEADGILGSSLTSDEQEKLIELLLKIKLP